LDTRDEIFFSQTACTTIKLTCLADIAEVFSQRANELDSTGTLAQNFVLFWEALSGAQSYSQNIQSAGSPIGSVLTSLFNTVTTSLLQFSTSLLNYKPTAATMAQHNAQLDADAAAGQYFVLVAHSQGNLFMNQAYDHIFPTVGAAGVKAVQIAVASTSLRGGYVTSASDKIIQALAVTGAVPAANFILPSNPVDWTGHAFVGTYLSTTLSGAYGGVTKTPVQVIIDLIATALQKLGIPSAPQCVPVRPPIACPNTFTQTQLNHIVTGMTVPQVNTVFGCSGSNMGNNNWYMWANSNSLIDPTLDIAFVFFTNGIYQGGPDSKSIVGPAYP